jgi:hypothetical protein
LGFRIVGCFCESQTLFVESKGIVTRIAGDRVKVSPYKLTFDWAEAGDPPCRTWAGGGEPPLYNDWCAPPTATRLLGRPAHCPP